MFFLIFFCFFSHFQVFSFSDESSAEGNQRNAEREQRGDARLRRPPDAVLSVALEVDVLVRAELVGERGQGGLVRMVNLAEGRWKERS